MFFTFKFQFTLLFHPDRRSIPHPTHPNIHHIHCRYTLSPVAPVMDKNPVSMMLHALDYIQYLFPHLAAQQGIILGFFCFIIRKRLHSSQRLGISITNTAFAILLTPLINCLIYNWYNDKCHYVINFSIFSMTIQNNF